MPVFLSSSVGGFEATTDSNGIYLFPESQVSTGEVIVSIPNTVLNYFAISANPLAFIAYACPIGGVDFMYSTISTISGTITQTGSNAIPDVMIILHKNATGEDRVYYSDQPGYVEIPDVSEGDYVITTEPSAVFANAEQPFIPPPDMVTSFFYI
eukprot:CFRG2556T1